MTVLRLRTYLVYRGSLLLALLLAALWLWTAIRPAAELGDGALGGVGHAGWQARAAEYIARVHGVWVPADAVVFLPLDDAPAWFESLDYVPLAFAAIPSATAVEMPVESVLPDLFYVELAMTPDGRPLDSRRFTNVTQTPQAAETVVAREGSTVVLTTTVLGEVDAIALLDFSGDRAEPLLLTGMPSLLAEVMLGLQNVRETGRWEGVTRTELELRVPVDRVESELVDGALRLDLSLRGARVGEAEVALPAGEVTRGGALLAAAEPRRQVIESAASWLANWLRDEWLGAERVALLEHLVFALEDRVDRIAYDWLDAPGRAAIVEAARPAAGEARMVARPEGAEGEWPPAPLDPLPRLGTPLEREGQWVEAAPDWLRRLPGAPPAFLQTFLRTDPERPWAWALVLAIDLRQVELRYQQGLEHPRPTTGRPGRGAIPRDPATLERLVAAFNGGYKTTHGASGSVADGVVHLAPMPGQATVAMSDRREAVLYGTWGETRRVPDAIASLRQGAAPLLDERRPAPEAPWRWFGEVTLDPVTERSALCFKGRQTLMYVWAERATHHDMVRVMERAGCAYGMRLDMNPGLTGWEFYRVDDPEALDDLEAAAWRSARPTQAMAFRRDRYLGLDERDFFYLLTRSTLAQRLPGVGEAAWSVEGMPTTSEGFLPVAAHLSADGQAVRLLAFDADQVRGRLAIGSGEPLGAVGEGLAPRSTPRVVEPVARVAFDAVDADAPQGLSVDGASYSPARGSGVWLHVDDGAIRVVEGLDPPADTRIELRSFEDVEGYGGVCVAVAQRVAELRAPPALLLAWGNVPDTRRRLDELGVARAGVLGCGTRLPRVEVVVGEPGPEAGGDPRGWLMRDVFTGDERRVDSLAGSRSALLIEAVPRPPRLRRLGSGNRGGEPEAP